MEIKQSKGVHYVKLLSALGWCVCLVISAFMIIYGVYCTKNANDIDQLRYGTVITIFGVWFMHSIQIRDMRNEIHEMEERYNGDQTE